MQSFLLNDLATLRQRELLAEADHDRLVRQALAARPDQPPRAPRPRRHHFLIAALWSRYGLRRSAPAATSPSL